MNLNNRLEAYQRTRDKSRTESSHGYVMAVYLPITKRVILSRTVDPARWLSNQKTRYGERPDILLQMHTGRASTILKALKAAFADCFSRGHLWNIPRSDFELFELLEDELPEPLKVPRRPEVRAQKRVSLSVQLVEGVDDDLIEWRENLPDGAIQASVKRALREALFRDETQTSVYDSTVKQRDDVLHQKVDWLHAMLKDGIFLEELLSNHLTTAVQQGIQSIEGVTLLSSSSTPPDGILTKSNMMSKKAADDYQDDLRKMQW